MSDVLTTKLYAIRIPSGLERVFNPQTDGPVSLKQVCDLRQLQDHLPLEDIFYLAYEQSNDPIFNEFLTTHQVYNIAQSPRNVTWLSEMKTKYDNYIQKREDMKKINPETPVNISPLHHNYNYWGYVDVEGNTLLTFYPVGADIPAEYPVDTKLAVLKDCLKRMTYDVFRRHPLATYLLSIHC